MKHAAASHPHLRGLVAMPGDDYHGGPGISKSKLDAFAQSPRHYWLQNENPNRQPEKDTEALIIGAASHCAVLEPDVFTARYIAVPEDAPRRPTKTQREAKKPSDDTRFAIDWWREFETENAARIILTADQMAECLALRDCVYADPDCASLLQLGHAEQSYFAEDEETGLLLKCRPDFLTEGGIFVDLKFVRDASPFGFGRACAQHRYDVQAAFYPHVLDKHFGGFDAPVFAFIAVEKFEHGPICALYYADAEMLTSGRAKVRREIPALAQCYANDKWPGYTVKPMPVQFPNYAKEQ